MKNSDDKELIQNDKYRKGQFLKINSINELLFDLKFEKDDYVQQPGDFARRGNIVDIFSFAYTSPLKLNLMVIQKV